LVLQAVALTKAPAPSIAARAHRGQPAQQRPRRPRAP